MHEDEPAGLKHKIGEVKQRLQQIHAESFADINRTKVFEYEFSLYLRACADAREERMECLKLQHGAVRVGLTVSLAAAALVLYLFSSHVLWCTLLLLVSGFIACGFMYVVLAEETKILRAGRYCLDMEAYFKRHRWSGEEHEKMHLPTMPLWDEYRAAWNDDLFGERHYGKAALYAPLRIAITATDILALAFILYSSLTGAAASSPVVYGVACAVWVAGVITQMLFVNTMVNKVGRALESVEGSGAEGAAAYQFGPRPTTVGAIIRLLFLVDLIAPGAALVRGQAGGRERFL